MYYLLFIKNEYMISKGKRQKFIMNYLSLIDDLLLVSKYTQGFHMFPLITFASTNAAKIMLFSKCYFDGLRYFKITLLYGRYPYYLMFKEATENYFSFGSDTESKTQFYLYLIFCEICCRPYITYIFGNARHMDYKKFHINCCICKK